MKYFHRIKSLRFTSKFCRHLWSIFRLFIKPRFNAYTYYFDIHVINWHFLFMKHESCKRENNCLVSPKMLWSFQMHNFKKKKNCNCIWLSRIKFNCFMFITWVDQNLCWVVLLYIRKFFRVCPPKQLLSMSVEAVQFFITAPPQ